MLPLLPFLLYPPYLFALLSILPSLFPVGTWDWIGVVSNCIMGMFLRYHVFHWPLRRCTRGAGTKCHPKHPYNGIRHNTHPISSTTSKQPNQPFPPPPPLRRLRTCSRAINTFTRWSYSLWWQMVVLTYGAWFDFRIFFLSCTNFRCFGETLSTLNFAKRAKMIKNKVPNTCFTALNGKACK